MAEEEDDLPTLIETALRTMRILASYPPMSFIEHEIAFSMVGDLFKIREIHMQERGSARHKNAGWLRSIH